MICIAAAAGVIALAADQFTLHWTHSTAHTRWKEHWQATPLGLVPISASIEGPGAGMELPEGATRTGTSWDYTPNIAPQREVFLAASGTTDTGWTLCSTGNCIELGAEAGAPIRLWQSPDCSP